MLRKSLVVSALLFLSFVASADSPQKANRIVIKKNAHELSVYAGDVLVKTYKVAIGPGGSGYKHREGDKVTPVGHYHVTMHQPSQFHQFLRLDYPNAEDRARFTRLQTSGELPKEATIGGDIGIHGAPPQPQWKSVHKTVDWTLGCVAVDDAEIDEIGHLVADGTPVEISD